jgi:hypothetical protein
MVVSAKLAHADLVLFPTVSKRLTRDGSHCRKFLCVIDAAANATEQPPP